MSAKHKIHLLLTALILGGMALFFRTYDPWRPAGPELIPDGGFESAAAEGVWSGWDELTRRVPDGGFNGSAGVVLNTTTNRHGMLRFTLSDLSDARFFRVSMSAAAAGVRCGSKGYHVPRAVFFFQDNKKKSIWHLSHGVMNLPDDAAWKRYSEVFPVPSAADNARLHVQNYGSAGELRVDNISLRPVLPRKSAPWWNIFFGTLWLGAFGRWLFLLRPWKRRCGALVTITGLLIVAGVVLPEPILNGGIRQAQRQVRAVKERFDRPAPQTPAVTEAPTGSSASVEKPKKPTPHQTEKNERIVVEQVHASGHFLLFCLLAFLSLLCWSGRPIRFSRAAAVLGGLSLFAASSEILQMIIPGRSAGWSDLLTDLAGITGAVLLASMIRELQTVFKRRRS